MLLVLSVLLVAVASHAEDADALLVRNGRFHTVAGAGVVEGSMVVRDGRIAYLGPDAEARSRAGDGARVLDLGGRAVTPGWIDAHSHLASLGRALEIVDLVGTRSYGEVVERVARRAEETPAGTWIAGRGWDQNDWAEQSFPTEAELSAGVPDHPVWLTRIDGHAALLNRAALAALAVSRDVQDPPGGRFVRDADGALTGVLIDAAMDVAARALPGDDPRTIRERIVRGAEHCLALGLTTVTEMGIGADEVAAYERLRREDGLPLRVAVFLSDQAELLEAWFERGPLLDPDDRLLVRGIKMYGDGALGSRGAALIEPYSDDPGNLGLLQTGTGHVTEVCRRALDTGFQIGIHAIGDRGGLMALDGFEACFGEPRPEVRFRVEHAQVLRRADIARMTGLGVIASMQPTHATSDMPWAEARVGPERIRGAYAWRQVLEAGGRLALGSDFPVEKADPLLGFYAALTRQDAAGQPEGGWYPDERLDRAEALRGFTLDAAYSLFLDDELGSLEVGKRADLVVFDRDPMTVPVSELLETRVDLTLVGGAVAFERGGTE